MRRACAALAWRPGPRVASATGSSSAGGRWSRGRAKSPITDWFASREYGGERGRDPQLDAREKGGQRLVAAAQPPHEVAGSRSSRR